MRVTRLWSAMALLVAGIVLVFCSVAGAENAQYRTARLVKVENATDLLDTTHKAAFLLLIQDGSDQYVAHYRVTYFGHVNIDLTAGTEVQFRISGENVFVKTPDGKEIKARSCHIY